MRPETEKTAHLLRSAGRDFRGLPVLRRTVIVPLAAAVAFYTFICGLVILFDRVGATEGHSVTAWVVSLVGLVVSAVVALTLAGGLLAGAGRYGQRGQTSMSGFIAGSGAVAAVVLLLVSSVVGALD